MTDAPGVFVLGGIAYRGDRGRVFRCAGAAQYTAGQGCAHHRRSGQPGRYRQTEKFTETIKTCATATGESAAAGRPARTAGTAGTDCSPCTGAAAAAFGETQGKTETETKAKTETKGKTRTQSRAQAAGPALTGGAKAEAKTQEAR